MNKKNKIAEGKQSLKRKTVILYYYTKPTTFVSRDIAMLQAHYDAKGFSFFHQSKWHTPILFFKQLYFILRYHTQSSVAFCMFAGYHSFLPALIGKLTNKPFVIILGGTDSVVIPSIGYGILNKGLIGKFARWSYKLTATFAPVHESLVYSQNTYYEEGQFQGVKHYVPGIKAHFATIHNGYDAEKFKRRAVDGIKNSFITVAFDLHKPHLLKLKGVDLILSIAPAFPDCHFTIIGLSGAFEGPDNVTLLPPVNQKALVEELSKHEFYFQLSLSEGFPNALCEAMLCNCIPIVSNVASMPEIVGDSGFVLLKRDTAMLKELINKALGCDKPILATKARKNIIEKYPLDKRKERFCSLIDALTSGTL